MNVAILSGPALDHPAIPPEPPGRAKKKRYLRRLRHRIRGAILALKARSCCALCGERAGERLTLHHLPGRGVRRFFLSQATHFTVTAVRRELAKGAYLCWPCHQDVHDGKADGSHLTPMPMPPASDFGLTPETTTTTPLEGRS
jgi:hypothetical protein